MPLVKGGNALGIYIGTDLISNYALLWMLIISIASNMCGVYVG